MTINAAGVYYRQLNEQIRAAFNNGADEVVVENVCGHRYLGTGLRSGRIVINGVPGNDLGAFMDGAEIIVRGNAQDGVGNTMNRTVPRGLDANSSETSRKSSSSWATFMP